jgi:trimeric autotransporter adhesin
MSPDMRRSDTDPMHERARLLASAAIDEALEPADQAWLDEHLATCEDCSAAAEDLAAIHAQLRALEFPEPPRDLWARTSAALDAASVREARSRAAARRRPSFGPLIGTAIAATAVVVVAGASLLWRSPGTLSPLATQTSGGTLGPGVTAAATGAVQAPIALVNGTSYWLAESDGVYTIVGGTTSCSTGSGTCTVTGGTGSALGSIQSDTEIAAVLSSDATRAAVWTADKIAIVTLSSTPQTVTLDTLTPRPTVLSTVAPTPAATAAAASDAAASAAPSASAALTAAVTAAVTGAPSATAILDGYEVVGRDPEFSADGTIVAFAARPVDRSTGPDVFIWRVGDERAHAISAHHLDVFDGWAGSRILVGEFSPGPGGSAVEASSYVFDPATGNALRAAAPMLIAGIDPSGTNVVYWAGAVEFDNATGLWRPGKGSLFYAPLAGMNLVPASLTAAATEPPATATATGTPPDPATDNPDATATDGPSAEATQISTTASSGVVTLDGVGNVRRWVVRWDATGRYVAAWTADGASDVGRVHVYEAIPTGGVELRLTIEASLASISFDSGGLIYTSPDGKTLIKPITPPATPAPTDTATPAPATVEATASIQPATVPADVSPTPGA